MYHCQRIRWLIVVLFVLASTGIASTTSSSGIAGATTVPICHASNRISAKVTGENGASSWFYFLITFTNNGATGCSLPGIQTASAVTGEGDEEWSFIGPEAKYQATKGVRRGAVMVRSDGGKAYVVYYVANSADWSKGQCEPEHAAAVLLGIPGLNHIYVQFSRLGANEICTKFASTAIGPISSRTY
jgi:hypothetical protein